MRKLYYNITITLVSIVVALVIGGIEVLGLIGDHFKFGGPFWNAIGAIGDNFGLIGVIIIGVFVASWLASFVIYRLNRYDEIEVSTGPV